MKLFLWAGVISKFVLGPNCQQWKHIIKAVKTKRGQSRESVTFYNPECFIFYCQTFLICSVSCNKLAFVLPVSDMIPPYTQWAYVMQQCQVTWSDRCWRVSRLPWRLNIPVVVIKAWQPAHSQAIYSFSHSLCQVCKQKKWVFILYFWEWSSWFTQ